MHAQSHNLVQLFETPWTLATRLLCPWKFPGQNTGVGCHFLLQGIFLIQDQTQVSHVSCIGRWILYTESSRKSIKGEVWTKTHTGRISHNDKGRDWSDTAKYKEWQKLSADLQKLGKKLEIKSLSQPSKRTNPPYMSVSDLQGIELWANTFLLLKLPHLW